MDTTSSDPSRAVVCLIAGREAAECFPTLLHYLQLGLVDESVDTLRVVLQGEPHSSLQTGTNLIHQERPSAWPLSRWTNRTFLDNVRRKLTSIQRGDPAVVHGLSAGSMQLAAEIAEASSCELVLTVSSLQQCTDRDAERQLQRAATLIVPSLRLRNALPASLRSKPIESISVGVAAASELAAFSRPERSPIIVHAGGLTDDCGVDGLLRAVKRVFPRYPNLLLFIVGKGPAEDGLRRLAESLEMIDSVTFTGKIDEWHDVLEASDIFCIAGPGRAWREEALWAMAGGVCVVAAEGNLCDELIDGRTAVLFPPGDEDALAQRLLQLLSDRAAARNLASAAQAHVRANNTPARMVSEHLRVYRRLAGRHQTLPFPVGR